MRNASGDAPASRDGTPERPGGVPTPERGNDHDYLASGAVELVPIPRDGFKRIAELFTRYADQEPDFTDMALVWLGETTGCRRILTIDKTDFGVYRCDGGKTFEMIDWC